MRIVHICSTVSDSTAAVRQHAELIKHGVESYIFTLENNSSFYNKNIIVVKESIVEKIHNKLQGVRERIRRKTIFKEYNNMPYSFSLRNVDITKYLQDDDIVHIHWAVGMLSLKQLKK